MIYNLCACGTATLLFLLTHSNDAQAYSGLPLNSKSMVLSLLLYYTLI